MHDAREIPEDRESCQRLLREAWTFQIELTSTCENLQSNQRQLEQENEELQLRIQYLLRQMYGRRSERFLEGRGQQHFDFGDDNFLDDPTIISAAKQEPAVQEFVVRRRLGRKQRSEKLPDNLERRTQRFEPNLPTGVQLEQCVMIGLDVVEVLEWDRGKPWVKRFEYPKYKLPTLGSSLAVEPEPVADVAAVVKQEPVGETGPAYPGEQTAIDQLTGVEPITEPTANGQSMDEPQPSPIDTSSTKRSSEPQTEIIRSSGAVVDAHGIIQAPRQVTLVEGGHFGFSVAAEVLFNKFGLHVPLYRQQDSLAQMGWSPNRSTLGLIVANSAEVFGPLVALFCQRVLATDVVGTDDTPVTLLTPREGDGSRQARFWLYRGRDGAPYDVFAFTDSRTRDGPDKFLEPFHGILSGDCYSGYVNIEEVTQGRIKFSACLGHARRYVFNAREQQPVLGSEMMAQFRQLYDIEDRARTMDAAGRLELRQRESVPVMNRLRELLDSEAAQRVLPKTKFGTALGYLRNHWSAFQVYLQDARVPIDNNDVERDLRRIAVGRNNWLFIGSRAAGERTAAIFSVMASAHRHDLDVWEYVRDALEKLACARAAAGGDVTRIPVTLLESLLPDVWAKSHPESIRVFRANEKQQRAENRRFKRAERRRQPQEGRS
jgi:hypothetical protein